MEGAFSMLRKDWPGSYNEMLTFWIDPRCLPQSSVDTSIGHPLR